MPISHVLTVNCKGKISIKMSLKGYEVSTCTNLSALLMKQSLMLAGQIYGLLLHSYLGLIDLGLTERKTKSGAANSI